MYEQYTDKQIVEMLGNKLEKLGYSTFANNSKYYPDVCKLIATIYKSGYIRGQLGRSFIIGEKKAEEKKDTEPVNIFKVGDKVKFLGLNIEDEEALGNRLIYPPVDTVGEVVESGLVYCVVRWPKGTTSGDGVWVCRNSYLKKVTEHWISATKCNVQVGDKVRMIDDDLHLIDPECNPVAGTMGVVEKIDSFVCLVQWPNGTTSYNDKWYHTYNELEVLLYE
nr:MAG TPA: hypothetical protein [Caudoviricetes sp.]